MWKSARYFAEGCQSAGFSDEGDMASYCKSIVSDTAGWEAALPSDNGSLGDYQATVLVAAHVPATRLVLETVAGDLVQALQRAHGDCARCQRYLEAVCDLLGEDLDMAILGVLDATGLSGEAPCDMCVTCKQAVRHARSEWSAKPGHSVPK
jgi:hypothetical protein